MKKIFTLQVIYCKMCTKGENKLVGVNMSSPVELLSQDFDNLSKTNKKIANFIINDPKKAAELNIEELSKITDTSTASVSRLVKSLGYTNFREFTLALAYAQLKPQNLPIFKEIDVTDTLSSIARKVFAGSQQALQDTLNNVDETEFARAVLRIIDCHQLGFFGLGGSSIVALDGYHKFLRTSKNSFYYTDYDIQLMQAVRMTKDDCAILISHSGKNQQTLKIANILKQKGVTIIGITSNRDSPLANLSDIIFISYSEESDYRSEGMYSLLAQITILDTLFMMVAVRMGPDSETTIRNVQGVIESTRD